MANRSENVVKVLIVDDHRMFSDSLNAVLEPQAGISVLAQVHDSREASTKVAECNPDVVLMDYNMPYLNGIELTKLLLRERPELKILVLSMYNEERLIESFRNIGARGYLFKTASAEEVIGATRKVHEGEYYFPDESKVADKGLLKKLKLSDREMEVVQLLKAGFKTKEIAGILHIAIYTAEIHRNNIKVKAGVKSDAEFMKFIGEI